MNRGVRLGGQYLTWRWWIAESVPWLPGLIVFAALVAIAVWLA
jgi:hypothetical protein